MFDLMTLMADKDFVMIAEMVLIVIGLYGIILLISVLTGRPGTEVQEEVTDGLLRAAGIGLIILFVADRMAVKSAERMVNHDHHRHL